MEKIIEKTSMTNGGGQRVEVNSTKVEASSFQTVEYLIYFFFGALEILLALRLVLRVLGAAVNNGFVNGIYGITKFFMSPFEGIFSRSYAQGMETTSVLEPATIIAIIIYALVAWGIVKLVRISSGEVSTGE
jgi:hypothetical protein